MTHPILTLLADSLERVKDAERKIADGQRERDEANIEVAAFEKAARAMGLDFGSAPPNPQETQKTEVFRKRTPKTVSPQVAWLPVFQRLYRRHAAGFGYDEIAAVADEIGVEYKRASLRTKMMNYVNAGYLERAGVGQFQITGQGKSFFQIDVSPNENGEAEASPDEDEVAASSLF